MITRAQAEALLTLAESLEACERQGFTFEAEESGLLMHGHKLEGSPCRMSIRLVVNQLIPAKQET